MTDRKQRFYFDTPLVRVKVSRIRFPRICPVCGAPAKRTTRISTSPRRKVWLRPTFNPSLYQKNTNHTLNLEAKSFLVDVCDEHTISDNAEMRVRALSSLIASIVAGVSFFALIYAGADYWLGRPVSPWVFSYLLVLGLSLLFVYVSFRPSALESSFRIIGFDFELQHVWLALSNPTYRNSFMSENQLNSELVTWIVKV